MLDDIAGTHVVVLLTSYGVQHKSGCRYFTGSSVTMPVCFFLHVPADLCDHVMDTINETGEGYVAVVPVELVVGAAYLN